MRKQLLMCALIICAGSYTGYSQLQKGNVLVGGDITNIDLSLNEGGNFSFGINPKAAWFIRDNKALGGYFNVQLQTAKGAGTSVRYGVGALGRYYVNDKDLNLTSHSRFFLEANVGIEGYNPATGDNTNGLGIGIGPGLAYFVTPNVGLEALVKYGTIIGFGSSVSASNLSFGLGFQIYLPSRKIKSVIESVK